MIEGTVDFSAIKKELAMLGGNGTQAVKNAVLQEVGSGLVTNIRRSAPKDTGQYSRTWHIKRRDAHSVVVGTHDPGLYHLLEITGSKPHVIVPRRAKALHYFTPDGREHFRMSVRHPGFKPIPHVRPSLRHVMRYGGGLFLKHLSIQFRLLGPAGAKYRSYTIPAWKTVKKKPQGYKRGRRRGR